MDPPSAGALPRQPTLLETNASNLGFWPWDPELGDYDAWEYAFLKHCVRVHKKSVRRNRRWFIDQGFRPTILNAFRTEARTRPKPRSQVAASEPRPRSTGVDPTLPVDRHEVEDGALGHSVTTVHESSSFGRWERTTTKVTVIDVKDRPNLLLYISILFLVPGLLLLYLIPVGTHLGSHEGGNWGAGGFGIILVMFGLVWLFGFVLFRFIVPALEKRDHRLNARTSIWVGIGVFIFWIVGGFLLHPFICISLWIPILGFILIGYGYQELRKLARETTPCPKCNGTHSIRGDEVPSWNNVCTYTCPDCQYEWIGEAPEK